MRGCGGVECINDNETTAALVVCTFLVLGTILIKELLALVSIADSEAVGDDCVFAELCVEIMKVLEVLYVGIKLEDIGTCDGVESSDGATAAIVVCTFLVLGTKLLRV